MSIQTSYSSWSSSGLNYNASQYERCSPNLVQLIAFLMAQWGGYSLGCEQDREIRGGGSISSHAYGAANDWRYTPVPSGRRNVTRTTAVNVILPWIINNSRELGIQAIHDYAGDRIWHAGRTSNIREAHTTWWKKQYGAGSGMGESWATYFHLETTRSAFSNGVAVRNRAGITMPGGTVVNPPAPTTVPWIMKYGGTPSAGWTGYYTKDGGKTKIALTSMADARHISVTLQALDAKTKQRPKDPYNWGDVSHTTSMAVLNQYMCTTCAGTTPPSTTLWDVAPPPTLRYGSTTNNAYHVKLLQRVMNERFGTVLTQDGVFGAGTLAGVKKMQGVLRTTQDGVYGPTTAGLLAKWLDAH